MNKFAVLAASLVASCALAFAVYSAESNPNTPAFPRVVASVRLTNQTQPIPTTRILNAPRTGLYRVSSYIAMTTPGSVNTQQWYLSLSWMDESGTEINGNLSEVGSNQLPPNDYGYAPGSFLQWSPPFAIEAVEDTPIAYSATGPTDGSGGTYELFISVEQLQ